MPNNNKSRARNEVCPHDVYIKGLCGNCGIRLDPPQSTSVSMIHSVPELKVTEAYAKRLGKADQEKLIQERKLVLLVDLDQTVLHTTHEKIKNDPNVHAFKLWPGLPTYYTKLRPHLSEFLEQMSQIYELHIFTFGCRMYAHKIASIIDPNQKYFGNRILSRNESKDLYSKSGNLNDLFPCGDAMVCIIDDRADVWNNAGNLIQVKPYSYFKTSISDGALVSSSTSANSVEEQESLNRDVDKLEALLGVDDDDDQDDNNKDIDQIDTSSSAGGSGGSGGGDNDKAVNNDDKICTDSGLESDSGTSDKQVAQQDSRLGETDTNRLTGQEGDSEHAEDMRSDTVKDRCDSTVDEEQEKKKEQQQQQQQQQPVAPADSPGTIEDHDDHLIRLQRILSHIHKKWYEELDVEKRYLVDGENYKMPDIKDIIRLYLRRYN